MLEHESELLKERLFTASQRASLSDEFVSAIVGRLWLERCVRAEDQLAKAIDDESPQHIFEMLYEAVALLGEDAVVVGRAQVALREGLHHGGWQRGIYRGTVEWQGEQYHKLYTPGFADNTAAPHLPGEWLCRESRQVPLDLDLYLKRRTRDLRDRCFELNQQRNQQRDSGSPMQPESLNTLVENCGLAVSLLAHNRGRVGLQLVKNNLLELVADQQRMLTRELEALKAAKDVQGLIRTTKRAESILLDHDAVEAARQAALRQALAMLDSACDAEEPSPCPGQRKPLISPFEAACKLAAEAGVDTSVIQAANHTRAERQFLRALATEDYAHIEEACNSPAAAVLPRSYVWSVKMRAKNLRNARAEAMVEEAEAIMRAWMAESTRDPTEVLVRVQQFERDCEEAHHLSAEPVPLIQSCATFWQMHAAQLTEIAVQSNDADIIEFVVRRAVQFATVGPEITEALRAAAKLRAATSLAKAHASENVQELLVAAAKAEAAGLDIDAVAAAYKKAMRMDAERCLVESLESGDPDEVGRACLKARSYGVSEDILEAVMAKRDLLAQAPCQTSETSASEHLRAALQVGLPASTSRLAELLAGALVQKTNASETLQLFADMEKNLVFSPTHSRIYSSRPARYGFRGGHPYFKPSGWARYSIRHDQFDQKCADWCVAYHGTMSQSIISILCRGLRRPGDAGVISAHGQTYSKTGKSIYLSPSVEYAAFPCYAQFFEVAANHWVQVVLQCRVRPGSFQKCPGTLGNKRWPADIPIDPNFESMDNLEWLLEDANDVVVYGVMVREFGAAVDVSLYGDLVRRVSAGQRGPEFEWTRLRAADLRKRGFHMRA